MNVKGDREPWDTPCKGICSTTAVGGKRCVGCGRTKYEVDNWNSFSKEHKIRINESLATLPGYERLK